jgi:anti-sigma B factor antagonist
VVDAANAAQVRAELGGLLGDDVTVLIADMAATTTLTLEGLQVLISAQKMAAQRGTGLRLAAARPNVLKFMDITGTRRLFSSHSSVEEAPKRGWTLASGAHLVKLRAGSRVLTEGVRTARSHHPRCYSLHAQPPAHPGRL